ncbi:hypothetical protein B0H12DRAFT_374978 [Mycena haematopus]|nr:hypothetical protein B0H12DRAFT_374978 [Mycena haematopus]
MELLSVRPTMQALLPEPGHPRPRTPPTRLATEMEHRQRLSDTALPGGGMLPTDQAVAAFRQIVDRAIEQGSTLDAAEALTALHRLVETATQNRRTPSTTVPAAQEEAQRWAFYRFTRPACANDENRMDDAPTTSLPVSQVGPPPPEPPATVVQSDPSELDSWLTEPLFVGEVPHAAAVENTEPSVSGQQLEPIVFSPPPPTQQMPPLATENGAPRTVDDTTAANERARARITALFAHRWERCVSLSNLLSHVAILILSCRTEPSFTRDQPRLYHPL